MDDPSYYGFPCYGEPTVKAAQDCGGPVIDTSDPLSRTSDPDPAMLERLASFMADAAAGVRSAGPVDPLPVHPHARPRLRARPRCPATSRSSSASAPPTASSSRRRSGGCSPTSPTTGSTTSGRLAVPPRPGRAHRPGVRRPLAGVTGEPPAHGALSSCRDEQDDRHLRRARGLRGRGRHARTRASSPACARRPPRFRSTACRSRRSEGAFLALLVELIGARRCIEVGTFTGYSSTAVALALPPRTGSSSAATCRRSGPRWPASTGTRPASRARSTSASRPAAETLDRLLADGEEDAFDFAFVDADKTGYDGYYEQLLRLVRPGGLIAFDNTLWDGEVLDEDARGRGHARHPGAQHQARRRRADHAVPASGGRRRDARPPSLKVSRRRLTACVNLNAGRATLGYDEVRPGGDALHG